MCSGLADENQYFELVRGDLEDALGSRAALHEGVQTSAYRRPDPRTVRIRVPTGTHVVELTRRAPVYSGDEVTLLTAYAHALQEFGDVPRVFATTASEDVLTRAIAVRCSQGGLEAETVEAVMQAIMRHATRTYEGVRVAVNVCLDVSEAAIGVPLLTFLG